MWPMGSVGYRVIYYPSLPAHVHLCHLHSGPNGPGETAQIHRTPRKQQTDCIPNIPITCLRNYERKITTITLKNLLFSLKNTQKYRNKKYNCSLQHLLIKLHFFFSFGDIHSLMNIQLSCRINSNRSQRK